MSSSPSSTPAGGGTDLPVPEDPRLIATLREREVGRKVFGRFRLLRELGVGGMGVVWLARDEVRDEQVALKFLPGMVTSDQEALFDLRREINRGLKLTHSGIVRLYDLHENENEGLAAISMEYVDGPTLAEMKMRQPGRCFDADEPLVSWISSICDVLTYLHEEARVIHRDVKPRNLMLTSGGRLKVADFGIAATLCDSKSRLTKHPGRSGTPVYMSPQQAQGRNPAPADDIYSLGATIYELLTSKPPFFRGSEAVILHQVATEMPPLMRDRRLEFGFADLAPIPLEWEEIVTSLLAKSSDERPRNVQEVAARLRSTLLQKVAAPPDACHSISVTQSNATVARSPVQESSAVSPSEPHAKDRHPADEARNGPNGGLARSNEEMGQLATGQKERSLLSSRRRNLSKGIAVSIVAIFGGLAAWGVIAKWPKRNVPSSRLPTPSALRKASPAAADWPTATAEGVPAALSPQPVSPVDIPASLSTPAADAERVNRPGTPPPVATPAQTGKPKQATPVPRPKKAPDQKRTEHPTPRGPGLVDPKFFKIN